MGDRAVDCARLESVCAERHRGFESPPIRPPSRLRFAGSDTRLREAGRPPKLERRGLHFVLRYLIESLSAGRQRYVGTTDDLRQRLREHNAGESSYTAKFRPWKLTTYVAFTDPAKAEAFERYLKSGSGHAFARKRLW